MKKKIMLSLLMIICMMLLISIEASAATSNTTIGYPETSLYNKNDPNLVPLEAGMDLKGKTLYFNTKWNLKNVIPNGYYMSEAKGISCGFANDSGEFIGRLNLDVTEDGNGWSYFNLLLNGCFFDFNYDEDFEYGNSNNWLTDKFTFLNNQSVIIENDAEFILTITCLSDEADPKDINISIDDLVLVTKEPGHLISTSTDISGSDTDITDLEKVLIIGALICMGLFILRSIKR